MLFEFHFNPVRNAADEVVGETFWMAGPPPKEHIFSERIVDEYVERGAMAFAGDPVTLSLVPDPNGKMARTSGMSMTFPGDKLILTAHVGEDTEPTSFTYNITHFPIPEGFRHEDKRQKANDDSETAGIRIAKEYAVKLVTL